MKPMLIIVLSAIITVATLSYFKNSSLCGGRYSSTGISAGLEQAREVKYEFNFYAHDLYVECRRIDGVVGGFQAVDRYTFYLELCPKCNLWEIKRNIRDHIESYIEARYCKD